MDEYPRNELENLIADFRMGKIEADHFFHSILKMRVIIIADSRERPDSTLFLNHSDRHPRLVVFSSDYRVKKFIPRHPTYNHVFDISFIDLFKRIPDAAGFVMNPTLEFLTFQVTPEQIRMIREDFM